MDRKVKASSLIEVIVSMTVIVIVFGIALMIFVNVTRVSLSSGEIKAAALLREQLLLLEKNGVYENMVLTKDSLTIEQKIKSCAWAPNLIEVHLSVYDANQKLLTELRKIELSNE